MNPATQAPCYSAPPGSLDSAFASVYPELCAVARARLRCGRDTLLDTVSLVHEYYIRLAESRGFIVDRSRFLHHASHTMRNIIIDAVRRRRAARHGGGVKPLELLGELAGGAVRAEEEILAVHRALEELEALDPRLSRVVEMRYFAGMTDSEIAEALQITERTVRRDWAKARLLLAQAVT